MANAIKKVLRRVRHKFTPPPKPEPLWKKLKAEAEAKEYKQSFWERDKKIVRDANFQKALIAMEAKREEQRLERERQEEIAEQRLKNLKKARRRLAKMRSENES